VANEVRILIIEDEAPVREALRSTLQGQQYSVAEATSGQDGLAQVNSFHPHLVILDLGLPDQPGSQVLQQLRQWTEVPVIILTVEDSESLKVSLLDQGADDYLTKPFGPSELLARVRVALRHASMLEATPIFRSKELEVDLNLRRVTKDGVPVRLTKTEFELLARLIRGQGRVVSQIQLLKEIWGTANEDQSHYLRIYINQLRKKIEPTPHQPVHILTEPGVGYRLI
jgi:two-component system KDP operon response regulator KdpE